MNAYVIDRRVVSVGPAHEVHICTNHHLPPEPQGSDESQHVFITEDRATKLASFFVDDELLSLLVTQP